MLLTLTYLLNNCMPWFIAAVGIATEFLNSSQIIQIMLSVLCYFTQNMQILFYTTFSDTLLSLNISAVDVMRDIVFKSAWKRPPQHKCYAGLSDCFLSTHFSLFVATCHLFIMM